MNTQKSSKDEIKLPDGVKLPAGHKDMTSGNADLCPYVQMNKNKPPTTASTEADDKTKKKEKKPKSGCPMMTSEKKRNPALESYPKSYDIPYISVMKFMLNFKGFMTPEDITTKRAKFESYPIFLQHSLFHDDETMKKTRSLEMCQRFFIYDTYREKGNKYCLKGEYDEAIKFYERALSCLVWLEYKKPEKKAGAEGQPTPVNPLDKAKQLLAQMESNGTGTTSSPKEMKLDGEKEESTADEFAKMREEMEADSLLATYTDENVILHDGEDVTNEMDKDMRKSMLLQLYLNLAVVYIRLSHFTTAKIAIEWAKQVSDKCSQVYYRRSQAIACNKESTLEELYQAKKDIELAIDMKRFEKIFQSEPGILKLLNLANVDEAYIQQAHFVEAALKERRTFEGKYIKELIARAKEWEIMAELKGISKKGGAIDGKTYGPQAQKHSSLPIQNDELYNEHEIAQEIVDKYARIIEFYQESEKPSEGTPAARKEMLHAKEILYEMNFVQSINFADYKKNPCILEVLDDVNLDLDDPDVLARLEKLKTSKIKEIFELRGCEYNFEVFKYAVDSYFKRKEAEKKAQDAELDEIAGIDGKEKRSWISTLAHGFMNVEFGLQLLVIILILVVFYLVNRNTGLLNKLLFKSK